MQQARKTKEDANMKRGVVAFDVLTPCLFADVDGARKKIVLIVLRCWVIETNFEFLSLPFRKLRHDQIKVFRIL